MREGTPEEEHDGGGGGKESEQGWVLRVCAGEEGGRVGRVVGGTSRHSRQAAELGLYSP